MARTYDDPCGLARALSLVGERWAMLVIRELLLGPKRFSQLRKGLPGASQSMLTGRLVELEEHGLLRRRYLGPPANAWVYELTDQARELEPAVVALARWGSRTPRPTGSAELSVDALALAMRTTFDHAAAGALRTRFGLVLDGDELSVAIEDGAITIARGPAAAPEVTFETTAATWRELIFAGGSLSAAERSDRIAVRGNRALAGRLVALFPRPEPYGTAAATS
ncbi:winged helix-turn-helix transcriptional regulator [Dactylosporangium salmoneum]|uniref:winged helix-turn-helix transcriptional regulator n=1 Tax=Dactylosporangium salmoneum TaxID=53361 RepID=UPI0031E48DBC